jgi:flagellar biosynthesis/type III secretory pathway protein FliH
VIGPVHRDELRARIHQLGPRTEEISMTIAEQLHEEGREEGLAKGREEGRVAALRSMLAARFGANALDASYEARLQAAPASAIDRYLQRIVVAESLAAVFE